MVRQYIQVNFPIVAGNTVWPLMGNFSLVGLNLLEMASGPHAQIDVCQLAWNQNILPITVFSSCACLSLG